MTYTEAIAAIKAAQAHAGQPGYNEYGVPLHACNGYRQDEHYWSWLRHLRTTHKTTHEGGFQRE